MKKMAIILSCIILPTMMLGDVAHAQGRIIKSAGKKALKKVFKEGTERFSEYLRDENKEDERKRLKRREYFLFNGIDTKKYRDDFLKLERAKRVVSQKKKKPDEIQRMRDVRDFVNKLNIRQKIGNHVEE